jgi:hypothetical protein
VTNQNWCTFLQGMEKISCSSIHNIKTTVYFYVPNQNWCTFLQGMEKISCSSIHTITKSLSQPIHTSNPISVAQGYYFSQVMLRVINPKDYCFHVAIAL